MYIHQCNMVRSIPSLKMASMPRRRMTIMVHSANANAPKNGDSIESPLLFPSSFIIPITSVYVQYFAYIFDLRLCIHCAHPSVLTAGPQRYTPKNTRFTRSTRPREQTTPFQSHYTPHLCTGLVHCDFMPFILPLHLRLSSSVAMPTTIL